MGSRARDRSNRICRRCRKYRRRFFKRNARLYQKCCRCENRRCVPRRRVGQNGKEAVGGVVIARYGVNTLDVIEATKQKIKEIEVGLPEGVKSCRFMIELN